MAAIPRLWHRPVQVTIEPAVQPRKTKYLPRFNLTKADWEDFTSELDESICISTVTHENSGEFVLLLWKIVQRTSQDIGRYMCGLSEQTHQQYKSYSELLTRRRNHWAWGNACERDEKGRVQLLEVDG